MVSETKLLGLTVQSDLGWQTQINNMVSKASRRLYMLSCLRGFGAQADDLVSVYMGYVRPICEYAAPVWHSNIIVDSLNNLSAFKRELVASFLALSTSRTQRHLVGSSSKH